jgi:hypothetical protein
MKSKRQKRQEAAVRAESYSYENSKAKRNGVSQDKWDAKRKEYIKRCS